MKEQTLKKIESLRSLEEIEGWRWCVEQLQQRDYEDGEEQALLYQEMELKKRKIRRKK